MTNIKLTLQYIGLNYSGYQKQKNANTIQQNLERAIFEVTGENVTTYASGRTDAGVNALGQVVNFFTEYKLAPHNFAIALNHHLPQDIRVIKSEKVDDDFNSRFSAKSKTYIYKIYTSEHMSVFDDNRVLHFNKKLDLKAMQDSCKILLGEHNFASFMSSNSNITEDTKRTIYDAHFDIDGDYITFEITGNGFLYNMVRIIVGTMLDIGTHKSNIDVWQKLFDSKCRNLAGKTVKPYALYLKKVNY